MASYYKLIALPLSAVGITRMMLKPSLIKTAIKTVKLIGQLPEYTKLSNDAKATIKDMTKDDKSTPKSKKTTIQNGEARKPEPVADIKENPETDSGPEEKPDEGSESNMG